MTVKQVSVRLDTIVALGLKRDDAIERSRAMIIPFAVALVMAAAGPTQPMPVSLEKWLSAEDYPPAALRAGEEGQVSFRTTVDDTGRASDCEIVASSGSIALDTTTCSLVMQRAQFEPAVDPQGRKVTASYVGSIRWSLPKPIPKPFADWTSSARLTLNAASVVTSCQDQRMGEVMEGALASCAEAATAPPAAMRALASGLNPRELFVQMAFRTGSSTAPIAAPEGFTVTSAATAVLTIAPDGSITGCRPGVALGVAALLPDLCAATARNPFVPAARGARTGTLSMTIAGRPR